MPRYIDADKLWNNRPQIPKGMNEKGVQGFERCLRGFSEEIRKQIDNSTADVVEVVRCKDCKYRSTRDCKMWYQCVICGDYHSWERDDYYCSYGERRSEDAKR